MIHHMVQNSKSTQDTQRKKHSYLCSSPSCTLARDSHKQKFVTYSSKNTLCISEHTYVYIPLKTHII